MKKISWQTISVIAVVVVAVVYALPTFKPALWPHKQINLGLDLQGGMHLVLEVQTEKAVQDRIERIGQDLRRQMKIDGIGQRGFEIDKESGLQVTLEDPADWKKFNKMLENEFPDVRSEGDEGNPTVNIQLSAEDQDAIKRLAVDQALETIRNRIDEFGVAEPDIRRQGEKRILIQLPGVSDTERAKNLIGKTAQLEFKLLDETHDLAAALKGRIPPGSELLYEVDKRQKTDQPHKKTPYLVKKRTLLTGARLKDARVGFDNRTNSPQVGIEFDRKGARIFEKVTGENVNRRLAIVLDNKVYSAPEIETKISGGRGRITGHFTTEEARDLAIALRAGALPAPVKILEERTVGPSLGADSIRLGVIAMIVSGILVVLFMIFYYRLAGFIADLALLVNILIMAAGLAIFQATLTLPGIAGFILTIGIAVDANVLIYERIREEMRLGKTPRASVDAGYGRATLTILDANVTTLIAALVLFQFGTGPIKGFAVTLSMGVLASMFTSLILTRSIINYLLINRKMKQLSI